MACCFRFRRTPCVRSVTKEVEEQCLSFLQRTLRCCCCYQQSWLGHQTAARILSRQHSYWECVGGWFAEDAFALTFHKSVLSRLRGVVLMINSHLFSIYKVHRYDQTTHIHHSTPRDPRVRLALRLLPPWACFLKSTASRVRPCRGRSKASCRHPAAAGSRDT